MMKLTLHYQSATETYWGFDTVCMHKFYPSRCDANKDVAELRRAGWMIDTAYPNRWEGTTYEVFAVIPTDALLPNTNKKP